MCVRVRVRACTHVCLQRPKVDVGNHPQSLFKVKSLSQTYSLPISSLDSHLAVSITCLDLPELQVASLTFTRVSRGYELQTLMLKSVWQTLSS